MKRLPRDLIVLAVGAAPCQVTWAQQPVLRAKVDNVQVDVVVTDTEASPQVLAGDSRWILISEAVAVRSSNQPSAGTCPCFV